MSGVPVFDWEDEEPHCQTCDDQGEIMICPDDMCHGAGECMHGYGMIVCPECRGASYRL